MLVFDVIGAVANAATAIGLGFAGFTYFRDSKRKAKQDTLEAYSRLQRETLSEINKWLPSEIKKATEDKTSDAYKELSGYLAEIERFCCGINEGIYDFDTFYHLSHGYFDSDKGLLKPRLMPLLEVKLANARDDYFGNIHRVWERMGKK